MAQYEGLSISNLKHGGGSDAVYRLISCFLKLIARGAKAHTDILDQNLAGALAQFRGFYEVPFLLRLFNINVGRQTDIVRTVQVLNCGRI